MKNKKIVLLTLGLALITMLAIALPQAAFANTTYFGLIPADKQADGCNLCHTSVPSLNPVGEKVKAAKPADKNAMAAALSGGSAAKPAAPAAPAAKPAAPAAATQPAAKAVAAPKAAQPSYKNVNVTLGKNGKQQEVKAALVGEDVFIPLKTVADLSGGMLGWDAKTKTATYDNWAGTVLTINERTKVAKVNDKEFKDVKAMIIGGRMHVSLGFLGERLDTLYSVKFEQNKELGKSAIVGAKWSQSAHATPVASPAGRDTCITCHNGDAIAQGVSKIADLKDVDPNNYKGQDCTSCHSESAKKIRDGGVVTLANGVTANMGRGALCASCHNSRRNNNDEAGLFAKKTAPHVGPQADVLTATGGMEFEGHIYPSSPHNANPNTCVSCHMAKDENGISNHSWDVNQVSPCANCHTGLTNNERIALGDYDGDGTIEIIQDEVEGLVHLVEGAIKGVTGGELQESSGAFKFLDASGNVLKDVPLNVYKAAWNLGLVENDSSEGVHNPAYVVTLLQQSYKAVTGKDVPNARIR